MYLCWLFCPDHHTYKYYATVCYGDYLDISCNYGRPPAISIMKAEFGRNSLNRCPITSGLNRMCGQHSVTNLVRTRWDIWCVPEHLENCLFNVKSHLKIDLYFKKNSQEMYFFKYGQCFFFMTIVIFFKYYITSAIFWH